VRSHRGCGPVLVPKAALSRYASVSVQDGKRPTNAKDSHHAPHMAGRQAGSRCNATTVHIRFQ
jgi:hypothetical protein